MPDVRRSFQALIRVFSTPCRERVRTNAKNEHARHKAGHVANRRKIRPASLEVIGRAHISGAFDRRFRRDSRKQECIMIGAELVVPVAISDVAIPDARLSPENLRRIDAQANVFENFGLGFVVVKGAAGTEAADSEAVRPRNARTLRADDVGDIDDMSGIRPRAENATEWQIVESFQPPRPFEFAVAAIRANTAGAGVEIRGAGAAKAASGSIDNTKARGSATIERIK